MLTDFQNSFTGRLSRKFKKNQNRLFGMAAMHAGFTQLQKNTN